MRRALVVVLLAGLTAAGGLGVRAAVRTPDCAVDLRDGSRMEMSHEQAIAVTRTVGSKVRNDPAAGDLAAALVKTTGRVAGSPGLSRAEARSLTVALLAGGPALSCDGARPEVAEQRQRRSGLTPRAERLLDDVRRTFGNLPVGGFSPDGIRSGHIEGSAHYEGRAVDVFFRPVSGANRRRGWVLAQWAVANAERLRIATVIYDERIWSSRWPLDRWRTYRHPDGPTENPVLLHRDHVHIDVLD